MPYLRKERAFGLAVTPSVHDENKRACVAHCFSVGVDAVSEIGGDASASTWRGRSMWKTGANDGAGEYRSALLRLKCNVKKENARKTDCFIF